MGGRERHQLRRRRCRAHSPALAPSDRCTPSTPQPTEENMAPTHARRLGGAWLAGMRCKLSGRASAHTPASRRPPSNRVPPLRGQRPRRRRRRRWRRQEGCSARRGSRAWRGQSDASGRTWDHLGTHRGTALGRTGYPTYSQVLCISQLGLRWSQQHGNARTHAQTNTRVSAHRTVVAAPPRPPARPPTACLRRAARTSPARRRRRRRMPSAGIRWLAATDASWRTARARMHAMGKTGACHTRSSRG